MLVYMFVMFVYYMVIITANEVMIVKGIAVIGVSVKIITKGGVGWRVSIIENILSGDYVIIRLFK